MGENELILSEYEYLLRIKDAGSKKQHDKFLDQIRKDLSGEYLDNLDKKIERWVDVTNYMYLESNKPVEFYIQAKMLYRDGFFEASIQMSRSICEMICYDLLRAIIHPFGGNDDIEKQDFRTLLKYVHDKSTHLSQEAFDSLNRIYNIGNNYVHPKSKQKPKNDSRKCLIELGKVIFELYGIKNFDNVIGKTIQTAYANFPDICNCYRLLIEVFKTPEAALKNMMDID
jgi:hypothetical protein